MMRIPALKLTRTLQNLAESGPMFREAVERGNLATLKTMLGPAWRGLVQQRGKSEDITPMDLEYQASFDWKYRRDQPDMTRLYEAAKKSQWNSTTDLDWSIDVDPENHLKPIIPLDFLPVAGLDSFKKLPPREKAQQAHAMASWLLSQFLHGEQGALFAACQVTEAVPWLDAKLYGSTQVVDEGRHVETFNRYLESKLKKRYDINDNLYVIIDALMSDSRWDLKFLGMQIMIEGLALGAFGFIHMKTMEPLLKTLLRYVITDEARHVHYGVIALQKVYAEGLTEKERREREEWAFEVSVLLRNRFFAHELWEEGYAAQMSRKEWDQLILGSEMMAMFRRTMFKRVIPNLKRIGLLSERIRPHYQQHGLLEYEHLPAAPELTAADLIEDR
ncbi:MAG: ferritin-like domain-containing protein [Deltaproteobacteria bacterium]|nr:ferritin-like domain-containing protein [Deltaproteobacteria bacterium]